MCRPRAWTYFTDRLLNFRGDKLTMFLGSDTIKKLITTLVPKTEFIYRERLSKLTYSGYKRYLELNQESAIIAFLLMMFML